MVGEGNPYEEALADVKAAIRFHRETCGHDTLDGDESVLEAFAARATVWPKPKFPVDAP